MCVCLLSTLFCWLCQETVYTSTCSMLQYIAFYEYTISSIIIYHTILHVCYPNKVFEYFSTHFTSRRGSGIIRPNKIVLVSLLDNNNYVLLCTFIEYGNSNNGGSYSSRGEVLTIHYIITLILHHIVPAEVKLKLNTTLSKTLLR